MTEHILDPVFVYIMAANIVRTRSCNSRRPMSWRTLQALQWDQLAVW